MKLSYSNLFEELKVDKIREEVFYGVILNLLEYKTDIHFRRTDAVTFAQTLGLHPLHQEWYQKEEMEEKLQEAFVIANRFERNCLEYLAEQGKLDGFNENKDVPEILEFDGKLQPIFDFEKCLFERVYVESPQDTDGTGKRDLLEVYIRRPAETLQGMKIPVFYVANPYMMGGDDDHYKTHDVDIDLPELKAKKIDYKDIQFIPKEKEIPEARIPKGCVNISLYDFEQVELECIDGWYEYFLSRGYGAVFAGGIGTKGSDGIRSTGSVDETISTIAVIDWLNGRAKAYTNKTDLIEVVADWCTGNVGMSGKSYLGTLCIAAATTGVEGLKTIIPEAFISNWYEYFRCNGVTAPALDWQGDDADILADYCQSRKADEKDFATIKEPFEKHLNQMLFEEDRISGNYNCFWDERNYLNHVSNIKASVFAVQGLNDWNVKTKHMHILWKELEKNKIPCKLLLHQGDHIYVNNMAGLKFNDILNEWMAFWLYGISNNVMEKLPNVMVQNNLDCTKWDEDEKWPFKNTELCSYGISEQNELQIMSKIEKEQIKSKRVTILDDLDLMGFNRKNENFTLWKDKMCLCPQQKESYRLAYTTPILDRRVRINGEVKITFRASVDKPAVILSAMLVDYGLSCRYSVEQRIIREQSVQWGRNTHAKDLVYFTKEKQPSPYKIITRGWMSGKNRTSNYSIDEVVSGEEYSFSFCMQPMDYTLEIGHQLVLILYGSDAEVTTRPLQGRNISVDQGSIELLLPIYKENGSCNRN